MNYTIHQVADQFGLTAHTLRYYDKEGLLPFLKRGSSGNRLFGERDLEWVSLICCLKDTGMPIKEIKQYCDWCKIGDGTVDQRKLMLAQHRIEILRQMKALEDNLDIIDAKLAFYEGSGEAPHKRHGAKQM